MPFLQQRHHLKRQRHCLHSIMHFRLTLRKLRKNCTTDYTPFTTNARGPCVVYTTIKYKLKPADLFKRLKTRLLRWEGHVARMPMHWLPRKLLTGWVQHKRPVGRQQMNFGRTLNKALTNDKISNSLETWDTLAQNRENWRFRSCNKTHLHKSSKTATNTIIITNL